VEQLLPKLSLAHNQTPDYQDLLGNIRVNAKKRKIRAFALEKS